MKCNKIYTALHVTGWSRSSRRLNSGHAHLACTNEISTHNKRCRQQKSRKASLTKACSFQWRLQTWQRATESRSYFFCGHKSTIERRPSKAEWKRVPTVKRQLDKQSWKVKLSAHSIFVQPRVKLYRRTEIDWSTSATNCADELKFNTNSTEISSLRQQASKQARMTNLCRFYDVQTIPATRDGRQTATMVWANELLS